MSTINIIDGYARYNGEIELIIKDKFGNVVDHYRQKNIVKIFAKEILSHRLIHDKVWDPTAGTGTGDWVAHTIDIDKFAAKYIVFGASFDSAGNPLDTADSRFYIYDSTSGGYTPIKLGPGAEYDGGLINAIPIAEPTRPLKRIEKVYFESSYQPSGTPLLQSDVRAINNIVVMETTLQLDEYNGFGTSTNDFFTITEVALVAGPERGSVGKCECDPRELFLYATSNGDALLCTSSGTDTISIHSSESEVDLVKVGDQIKIVDVGSTAGSPDTLNQVTPYYLVVDKKLGGRDITLDRVPVDMDGNPIIGDIGILRDDFRIFSHRILASPVKKSAAVQITARWRIIMG